MAVWQIAFCLTVFAFLCRAFIPVGYMPDLSGERDAAFSITLCSMGGVSVVQWGPSSDQDASGHDEHYGDLCPYALNLAQKWMPGAEASAPAGPASFHALAHLPSNLVAPSLRSSGPPLGPRAPPVAWAVL